LRNGQEAEKRERWDLALLAYQKAYESDPGNLQAKVLYDRMRLKAGRVHYERGKIHRQSGQVDLALVELEQAIALDPANDAAQQEYKRAKADVEKRQREVSGGTPTEKAKAGARGKRAAPPMLSPSSDRPIDVTFPPDTNIKKIYQSLCAAAGINVIFDLQLKDDRFTLDLRGMTFQRALEVTMRQAGHFYKVLDERTILIAQDTQQNRREYEDLVIRTFFLSNGDVKDVSAMVRGVLDMRRLQTIPALNAIVIRDTADKVAVAERLIEVNDKAKSEVIIDVELILITQTSLLELGTQLSQYSTTSTVVDSTGAAVGALLWEQIKSLGLKDLSFTIPSATFTFIKNNTDAQVLAKPQMRIAEGEKGTLVIGDRVPIPVTTINTQTAIGNTSLIPVTSFQYQDVGIKVEIEPRVHHNKEVTLKILLEISNISGYVSQANGPSQPQIGTRNINTTIRLKDGETNFLAGLIRRDQSTSKDKIPILGDIPLIGPLFTHVKNDDKSTDVFMTLTPHIVRAPQITEDDLIPIWVGTENNVSFSGQGTRMESGSTLGSPFDASVPHAGPRPAVPPAPRTGAPVTPFSQGAPPSDPFRRTMPEPTTPQPTPTPVPQPPRLQPGPGSGSSSSETPKAPPSSVTLESPALRLESASSTIAPGETTVVSLVGEGGLSDSRLLELSVEWDPTAVEVTGIAPGPWSSAAGAEDVRFDSERVPGRARLQLLRRSGTWGLPKGMLAQLAVRATGGGTALFRVSAGSASTRRGPVAPSVVPTTVTVSGKG
jgi:general secretion pathway protein D